MAAGLGAPVEAPLQPPPDVNTADTSEAMLHKLDDFKKLMAGDRMGFLYDRWRNHPCASPQMKGQWQGQPVFGQGWQENESGDAGNGDAGGLYQLKVINWGFIWGARGRLNNLHSAAEALQNASDQVFQKVHGAWTSKAGDAAANKFTDLRAAARDYADQVQTVGAQMDGAWHTTRQAVEQLSNFATQTDVGGKPMFDKFGADGAGDDHGNGSRQQWSRRIDEINKALQNGTKRWGIEAHEVLNPGTSLTGRVTQTPDSVRWPGQVYLTEGDNMWADQACNWLDDMAQCYFLTIANFRRRVEETLKTVKTAWSTVYDKTVNLPGNPFDKLTLDAAAPPPGGNGKDDDHGKDKNDGKDGSHPGNGGHHGSVDGGGPVTPGSAGGPDTGGSQPVDHSGTQPSQTGGSVDPGTGPNVPGPGQPQPGQPGQPQQHETVTIQDGDRKISVDSPAGGHVKLTVDDGSGHPKTYDMDFGPDQQTPGQHTPGQQTPGQHSVVGGQPDPTQGAGSQPGTGHQGQPSPQNGQAHTLPAPADGSVQHAVAGPDGKAVIHDGNVTITAEQPPGSNQVKITVDDGSGHPATYMIDYADPSNPQIQHSADPAAQHAAGFAQQQADAGQHAQHAAQPQQASGDYAPTDQVQQAGSPRADTVWAEPHETPLTTSVQSNFGFDDGAAHSPASDGAWSTQGDLLDGNQSQVAPAAGDAGLATVPDDGGAHHQQQGAGAAMGGMPMMGAMGGGGGGGGGGDQERGASAWSTQGDLFDDGPGLSADRINTVLGDEG
ncbi:hypothetical protein [Actinocrispum wychmicini]|uniref:Type VII secretion system (Wss) protein ESAT-6 n=1 Tax=Actinocrispum wychmicini TaxID=1213861 RepID=A0A4R2K671_9PSEU|nr:hypothetical protein [Actinocrispum wychmicini]TCO65389.1 hypothetical protein EV192_1011181 [Actinocrispum wychmicini]